MANRYRMAAVSTLLALAAGGCGSASDNVISGNVIYGGKGLPTGTLVFVPAQGDEVSASISDGKYAVNKVPLGEAKVYIMVPTAAPMPLGGPPGAGKVDWAKKGPPKDALPPGVNIDPQQGMKGPIALKIPPVYTDKDKTPLRYIVVGGKQEKDFELK